eukprot:TRINITY_DN16449_c0_g2_i1.p2 TRINITY_DN16449_c0_g2~~TRINITY_DN16449_c0_g2_i1.p2  ORF type:complete len:165 (-),score=33.54 TRINITY_DN16449_c0_g2_i1:452-946(-)
MQLDVLQRDSKRKELSVPATAHRKLPEPVLEARFNKLFEDSLRKRGTLLTYIELCKDQPAEKKRRLTPQQMTRVYDTNVEKLRKRNLVIMEKRRQKEQLEEEEALEQRRAQKKKAKEFFKRHNYISTKESPRFMDRLDDDVERRADRCRSIQKIKERQEKLKVM